MDAFTYVVSERAVRRVSQFLFLIVVSIACAAPLRRLVVTLLLCTFLVKFQIS